MNRFQLLSKPHSKACFLNDMNYHDGETNIQSLITADVPTRYSATFERHYKNRGSNFLLAFGEKKVLFGESRSPFEEHAEIFTDMQFGGRFSELAEKPSFHENCFPSFESDDTFSNRIDIHWPRQAKSKNCSRH